MAITIKNSISCYLNGMMRGAAYGFQPSAASHQLFAHCQMMCDYHLMLARAFTRIYEKGGDAKCTKT
jgi:hypothetical protein